MVDLQNDAEFQRYIGYVLDKVIKEMADDILRVVQDYINKDIYNKDDPYVYDRSEQFLNSWISHVEGSGTTKEVVAEIFSDVNLMDYRSVSKTITDSYGHNHTIEVWQHGSPAYGDLRAEMSAIIENGMKYYYPKIRSDRTWNPAAKKRPFFQDTIKYLDSRGRLFKMFKEKMNKYGLIVEQGGSTSLLTAGRHIGEY